MDPDLTVEKAKEAIRQKQAVHEQQTLLQKEFLPSEQSSVDAMRTRPRQHKPVIKAKRPISGSCKCSRCEKVSRAETNALQEMQFVTNARKEAITALSVTANIVYSRMRSH